MPKTLVINGVDFPLEGEEVIRDGETLPVLEAIIALPGSVPVTLTAVGSTPAAAGASLSGQALTLQPASATLPGVVTAGAQSFGGAKTFASTVEASNLSGTNTGDATLAAIGAVPNANGASLTGQVLNLQPADGTFGGVLTAGAQSIAGAKTFTGAITASNLSGTNSGDVTLAAVGAVPNANGATLAGQVLNLQPASSTQPGVLASGDQTIGSGVKSVMAGTGSGLAALGGVLSLNVTAVGNVGAGEDNLMSYSLPADSLVSAGRGVRIKCWGTAAADADVKVLKLKFGAATINTHTVTATTGTRWVIDALVLRTGASTQDYMAELRENGAASLPDIETGTATETETGAITILLTGEAVDDNDLVQEGMLVELI